MFGRRFFQGLLGTGENAPDGGEDDPARSAAEAWLSHLDAGSYHVSWESAASLLRGAIAKDNWERTVSANRSPLGKLLSRELASRTEGGGLPGADDREFVILQYDCVFEHNAEVVETVTPMRDDDGAWRVSSYYVR